MFTRELIKAATNLSNQDVAYVLGVVLRRKGIKGPVSGGEALCLLIYDLIKQMGFPAEQVTAIVSHFGDELLAHGKMLESEWGEETRMTLLQILDNRFAMLLGNPMAYDFIDLEPVKQIPLPVLSVAIALPRLYQRALLMRSTPQASPPVAVTKSVPSSNGASVV